VRTGAGVVQDKCTAHSATNSSSFWFFLRPRNASLSKCSAAQPRMLPLRPLKGRDKLCPESIFPQASAVKTIMSFPHIDGVVETCLYSHDLPRSIRFYQDQLGLRLLESGERLCVFSVADKQVLLIFRSGGTYEPIHTSGGIIPPHEAAGQLHIAFAVSKDNFAAWEQHLLARGIAIEGKVNWPRGGESLYFRDPDNHLVEFATPGIWEVY
jgi:catechol 2,3-dioxygenase-like lactoylglutathione lyase family enzyme